MQQVRASMPGIVMIIVSLVFLSQSILMEKAYIFDPAEGSFFPALISLIMLLCGVTVIVQSLYAKNKRAVEETEEDSEGTFTFKDYKYILTFFMLSVIYVILLYYITFFP